jgi:putative copper resistance protein D
MEKRKRMKYNLYNSISSLVTWSPFLFLLLLNPYILTAYAGETASHHNHDTHTDHNQHADHNNYNGASENDIGEAHAPEPHAIVLTPPGAHDGGHHHRPPLLPPAEDQAYSELNHHIAGVFVLLAGGLAMLAVSSNVRYPWARYGLPGLFFLMGMFLVFRHDPESWPHGPLSLQESLSDPQIVQHVIFTFIILGIAIIEWLRCRGTLTHPLWGLVFPALAVSAAFMLFAHKHGEGPSADKVYRHHVIMAVAGILAMIAKVLDDTQIVKGKIGGYLWTGLMTFIGLMLLIYSE